MPLGKLGALAGVLAGVLGCGQQYRPVVSAVNPVGPAAQPGKYAVAVSSPGGTTPGLVTLVDFSGDTVVATQPILNDPTYFALAAGSGAAYAINAADSLTQIPFTTSPNSLLPGTVIETTLPTGANAPTLSAFVLGGTTRLLVPEAGRSAIAVLALANGASPALQQELAVGANPDYVVGLDGTPRAYALSAGTGEAAAIEGANLSISATIPVGANPVYGVETADFRRAFIMNKGSGTVSVINVTNNAPDAAVGTIPVGPAPVWADLAATTNELVVVNQGDGVNPGSVTVISIPLCNALAQPTNPTCDATNPVDGLGFGTVLATVPVGVNPQQIAVLADGSRAYVVNQGRLPGTLSSTDPGVNGSVSVVNLVSNTVTATVLAVAPSTPVVIPTCPDGSTLSCIYGNPGTLAVTNSTPTGKVYITATNSNYLTVLETDTDAVDTHINLQGAGIRVRVTAP